MQDRSRVLAVTLGADHGTLAVPADIGGRQPYGGEHAQAPLHQERGAVGPEDLEFLKILDSTSPGQRVIHHDGAGDHHGGRIDDGAGFPVGLVEMRMHRPDPHPAIPSRTAIGW